MPFHTKAKKAKKKAANKGQRVSARAGQVLSDAAVARASVRGTNPRKVREELARVGKRNFKKTSEKKIAIKALQAENRRLRKK